MIPQENQIYRHFKGNLYRVITVAEHTENSEQLVVYQALYGEYKVFARPLAMFLSEVDRAKYPDAEQKLRFEPVDQMVGTVITPVNTKCQITEDALKRQPENELAKEMSNEQLKTSKIEVTVQKADDTEETLKIDPLLEAYLDTDSYREKINILHGLQHRITENMLITMAVAIDFELPEGDIQTQYNALNDCLLTKEKYECNRIL